MARRGMKFSCLTEVNIYQRDVFGTLFESVRRQVEQKRPVQGIRGFSCWCPRTLPTNLIQRGPSMTATMITNGQVRKNLASQLDRLHSILDCAAARLRA